MFDDEFYIDEVTFNSDAEHDFFDMLSYEQKETFARMSAKERRDFMKDELEQSADLNYLYMVSDRDFF